MASVGLAPVRTEIIPLMKGEDLMTPQMLIEPGRCLLAHNYFPAPLGGYSRIPGYERYDGQAPPSETPTGGERVSFTSGTDEIAADDTLTQGSVTATVYSVTITSGAWATNDAAGYIVVTGRSGGDFAAGSVTSSPSSGSATLTGAQTDEIAARRADIDAVPGSGPIRGVWVFQGDVYAFRNNAGGTACVMWVSTTSGWSECDLGELVEFDTGSAAPTIGEDLEQGAVTAAIAHVYVATGDWSTSDAEGYMVLYGRAGGDYASGAATTAGGGSMNLTGAQTAESLAPGGRYEFVTYNFYATSAGECFYGVSGVDQAFEWDGSIFIKIITGMDTDTPEHVSAHKNHLFLSYDGGSVQHSPIGEPTSNWAEAGGAGEVGVGADVTALRSLPGGVLGIFCRNKIMLLSGSSTADFALAPHTVVAGARPYTLQQVSDTTFLDDLGITNLTASDAYGGFIYNALSAPVRSYVTPRIASATASTVWKKNGLYLCFFMEDDSGKTDASIVGFAGPQVLGFTRAEFPIEIVCAANGEIVDQEHNFVGCNDGYVYELFRGTSFDGEEIPAYLKLPFNSLRAPRIRKRWRRAVFDISSDAAFQMQYQAEFDYADAQIRKDGPYTSSVVASGSLWNIGTWNSAVWTGQVVDQAEASLQGYSTNMSLLLYTVTDAVETYTVESVALHYSANRIQR